MFSEKIDIATNGMKAYAKDLKDIIKKICKAIAEIGDCDNVDVEYYTDSEIANYTFYDCDTDGYGVGIYIGGGRMIDASSSAGCVVTRGSISTNYWTEHFLMAYRIWG